VTRATRCVPLALLILLGAMVVGAGDAKAAGCSARIHGILTASTCGDLAWRYDAGARAFTYDTQMSATDDPNGDRFVYQLVATCASNGVGKGTTQSGLCGKAANCPLKTDPDGKALAGIRWQATRAKKKAGGGIGTFVPVGEPVCVYRGKSVPLAAVSAAAREQLSKVVGRPTVAMAPPGGVQLIHLPVLYSAPDQQLTTLAITAPVPGTISAVPSYSWDLGEGQTAEGAGHGYDPRVDPLDPASDGWYVKGRYNDVGVHPVRVTLTWTTSITLGGGAGQTVALAPITFTATAQARTVSATNRLYSDDAPTP
jgi:hypothetical protein